VFITDYNLSNITKLSIANSYKFFRTTQELVYLFFFVAHSVNFFPEFNIRLCDKNSESDYFFFPPPNERIINDRPIASVSNDPRDLLALTPSMLLLMKSNVSIPPGVFDKNKI
jgi:hypothetical protein